MDTREYQRQVKAYQREHPVEASLWKSEVRAKGEQTAYREYYQKQAEVQQQQQQAQAQAQWKQQVMQQYPAAYYEVKFLASGEAQITQRPTVSRVSQQRSYGTLEPEAQMAFKTIEQQRAVGTRTTPQYKGVTKRYGSLAEYDIPYNIEEMVSSSRKQNVASLQASEPRLFTEHYREVIVPKEIERGWHKPEGGESRHWVTTKEFQELYGVQPSLPETAKITYMQRTKEGYELQFYTPREAPKTITALFERAVISTDVPVFGGPVGGVLGVGSLGFQIKTWEATVGEVEEHVFKQPTARSELMAPSELLLAHGLFATIATVKVAPKITRWVSGTRVGQAIKFSRVAKTFETVKTAFKSKLPTVKGSRVDVWLAKYSKLYYEKTSGIARGEVAQKVLPPKGVSLGELKWSERYWQMIQAPRTGGVMIGKSPLTTKGLQTYTFEWILKGGQLVPQFRPQRVGEVTVQRADYWQKYWQPERGLTPFVTQTQLTRMGIYPASYVGGKTTAIGSSYLSSVATGVGLAVTPRVKFQQKPLFSEWQPTFNLQRERLRMFSFETPTQRKREVVTPMLKTRQLQRQTAKPQLKLRKMQRHVESLEVPTLSRLAQPPAQKQEAIPSLQPRQRRQQYVGFPKVPKLTPPTLTPPTPFYRKPFGGQDVSREPKGLGGRWFKRSHRIKEPEEMLRSFERGPRFGKEKRRRGGGFSWF